MPIMISAGLPAPDSMPAHRLMKLVRAAEAAGLEFVSMPDIVTGDGEAAPEAGGVAMEPVTVLAAAAGATDRIGLDFGVLSVPTRPVAMLAAQLQALQLVSGGRVRLGLGIGGFAGSPFWRAVGAPESARGQQLDAVLEQLPLLIAGHSVDLPDAPRLTLRPAAPVPLILVGSGDSEVALRRIAALADGWVPSAMTPARLRVGVERLRRFVDENDRPAPQVSLGIHAVLGDDVEARQARAATAHGLGEAFGLSSEDAAAVMLGGSVEEVADRIAEYVAAGATGLTVAIDGPHYERQLALLAEARSRMA